MSTTVPGQKSRRSAADPSHEQRVGGRSVGGVEGHVPGFLQTRQVVEPAAAEDAQRGGRMPALHVVVEMHGERDLGLDLEPCHVCREKIAAAGARFVCEREEGGEDRHRGMPAKRVVAVVEIERMRRRAVDERGVKGADTPLHAEQRGAAGCGRAERLQRKARGRLAAAGERHAEVVENADLCPMHCLRRQLVEAQ